jgi:hypothetical protein
LRRYAIGTRANHVYALIAVGAFPMTATVTG